METCIHKNASVLPILPIWYMYRFGYMPIIYNPINLAMSHLHTYIAFTEYLLDMYLA